MKTRALFKTIVCLCVCFVILSLCTAFANTGNSGKTASDGQEMTKQQRLDKTIYLQNLNYAAACDGVLTVINPADKTVTPVIYNQKFYVPLRFVLETYGVVVSWEHETKTVVMAAVNKEYRLSTSDTVMSYGDKTKALANPCFIRNGTTYVAFDDISEIIGCKTYYFDEYKAGVIAIGEDWDSERQAEKDALGAMEFAVSPFFKMFA